MAMREGQQATIEDIITPKEKTQARSRPIQASIKNLDVQKHAIFQDGYTPSHESIEYH